jgi:RNA polymerase sigma-70 factor (ECF subfamily)
MVEVEVAPGLAGVPASAGVLDAIFASEGAFDAWYAGVLPRVYGYLFSRCGHDPDLAEELTQRTFVDAVRSWTSFAGRSDPFTWLCSIARHKLADHYRHLDTEERRHLRLVAQVRSDGDCGPAEDLAEREIVLRALNHLPSLQRAVLVFVALDGLTVREAAGLLDRSESATESLLHRARLAFRQAYVDEGGGVDA